MVGLSAGEANELRDQLRQAPAAESVSGTIAVSANASTSVTLTRREKVAVLEVLSDWLDNAGGEPGGGLAALRDALARDLEADA
jgi:hypothetical protein